MIDWKCAYSANNQFNFNQKHQQLIKLQWKCLISMKHSTKIKFIFQCNSFHLVYKRWLWRCQSAKTTTKNKTGIRRTNQTISTAPRFVRPLITFEKSEFSVDLLQSEMICFIVSKWIFVYQIIGLVQGKGVKPRHQRNILKRMEKENMEGPLGKLKTWKDKRTRIKVIQPRFSFLH